MNQTVKSPLIDTILRIVVLFLLIAWCIGIILPFLEPVIWGAIIAIGLHPFFAMVKRWVGKGLLMFFVSVIIAGAFLVKEDASAAFVRKLIHRLAGERSDEMISITGVTVKNVAKGILGVAFFQFLTAGAVFVLANVPLPGLWAFAVLVLAILQLPSVIVILPVIIYLFSVKELAPAILWTIALLFIALSDNVLKPLLMGKGSTVPMLVIFLGAIGGFIFSGLIGLFTGAIVLSVGYNLIGHWIGEGQN